MKPPPGPAPSLVSTPVLDGPFPVRLRPTGPGQAHQQPEAVIESGRTSQGKGSGPLEGAAVAEWIAGWQPEEPPLVSARQRAAEVGVGAVDPATGATLRLLAAATSAKS